METLPRTGPGNLDATVENGEIAPGRIGTGALRFKWSDSSMRISVPSLRYYLEGKPFTLLWWRKGNGQASGSFLSLSPFEVHIGSAQNASGQVRVLEPHDIHVPNYAGTELFGNWRHYALVFDGSQGSFYEDGILRIAWTIGGLGGVRADDDGSFFISLSDSIDDVRIYDVALSLAQIASLGPSPGIEIKRNPSDYRVGIGDTVTLTAEGFAVATQEPLSYEWQIDEKPVLSSGNTVSITGSSPGIARVRAKISAGNLVAYTREATIETVASDPTFLLHYDFENDSPELIRDSAGSFHGRPFNIRRLPGRVGRYGAGFEQSYIRVPAAGTALELVGTPYTVAWWMRLERPLLAASLTAQSPQPWGEIIYDLGPEDGPTGFGAQTLGNRMIAFHKSVSSPAISAAFIFNFSGWMHFTITYDGETSRLFLNGNELPSSQNAQPIIGSGTHDLYLGNSTDAIANGALGGYQWGRNAFGGLMDDFRIYSYALTASQIRALVDVSPPLVITAASGRIGLAWPETSEAVFTLEHSASLSANAQWSPVTPAPTAADGRFQVVLNPTQNSTFFRLNK